MLTTILFMAIVVTPQKQIEKNGMTFSWSISAGMLHCHVAAPTRGWVAVGFNTKDQLEATNLIMGAVVEGFYHIQDRYIMSPGTHKSMLELGADERLRNRFGEQKGNLTILSFSIPLRPEDGYHPDFYRGRRILCPVSLQPGG